MYSRRLRLREGDCTRGGADPAHLSAATDLLVLAANNLSGVGVFRDYDAVEGVHHLFPGHGAVINCAVRIRIEFVVY
jgi:hypothetical protein